MASRLIPWLIAIILFCIILLLQHCRHCPPCPEMSVQTIIIPGDTIPKPYPVITPVPDSIIYVPIPANIDTQAIIQSYFSHTYGTDTLANDSAIFISIDWHIFQNRLQSIKPYIANRRPLLIQNFSPTPQPKNRYYLGLTVSGNKSSFGLGPSATLLTSHNTAYSLHYDLLNHSASLSINFSVW